MNLFCSAKSNQRREPLRNQPAKWSSSWDVRSAQWHTSYNFSTHFIFEETLVNMQSVRIFVNGKIFMRAFTSVVRTSSLKFQEIFKYFWFICILWLWWCFGRVNKTKEDWCLRLTFMRHGRYIVTDVTKSCPNMFLYSDTICVLILGDWHVDDHQISVTLVIVAAWSISPTSIYMSRRQASADQTVLEWPCSVVKIFQMLWQSSCIRCLRHCHLKKINTVNEMLFGR